MRDDQFIYCKQIKFNNKMSQKQLATRSYTRKKIQNFSYGLNDTIGKGYSSQVFKGRNDESDQLVAVKVIDLKMLKCQINRTLLASEIQILKSLRNVPNILHLHEVYTTKNNTYIITELCESDLSRRIKKKLSEQEVFNYMSQFINGYSYIFDKKLIHRDLKPANLLLTPDNELKIADFGFGIKAQEVLKPSKYNVGSPLYMAPQSLKRNQYSFKTDIWAIGIIFFEMLTCDTPWRAKNEKELLKKIQGEKIQSIINKRDFSPLAKEFLLRTLTQDKASRLDPEELIKFNFKQQYECNVLGEKKLNSTIKSGKYMSIIDKTISPKNLMSNRSIDKKLFKHDFSDKKIQAINKINHNSVKDTQNTSKKNLHSPSRNQEISKQERKHISKLMIAEVHFCRFLYKLLGRVKESVQNGILNNRNCSQTVSDVFNLFTGIIKHKIINLKSFEDVNFLKVQKYDDYQLTSDFKKLIKISKDYFERYSSELKVYWNNSNSYTVRTSQVDELMFQLLQSLQIQVSEMENPQKSIESYSKDIVILDYLMTCRQLLDMIKDGENYERFAKKSRIQEIVEGSTGQINYQLYKKIVERARNMLNRNTQMMKV